MNNDIRLLITAGLNTGTSVNEINQNIKQLQKVVDRKRLNLKINLDSNVLKQIEQFNTRLKSLGTQAQSTKKMVEEMMMPDGSKRKRTFFDDGAIAQSTEQARQFNTEQSKGLQLDKERERVLQSEHRTRRALAEQEQKNREKALQYEQRTRSRIEQNNKLEKEKSAELQRQLALYQRQAQLNAQNIKRTHGTTVNDTDLRNYLNQVNALTTATPNLNSRMRDLSMQFREVSGNARDAAGALNQSGMSITEMMRTALVKFPIWILASSNKTSLIR